MDLYVIIIVFVLFLLFLILGLYLRSTLFLIFAAVCSVIMVYDFVNTGIEYPSGTNTTITTINDSITIEDKHIVYERIDSFWVNSIIAIFSIIALALIWQAAIGFDENE